jgi:predicted small metal-binding protein
MEEMPVEGSSMDVTNECACGWSTSGPLDHVVDATIDHGRRLHNMEATREEVVAALAETADGASASSASGDVRTEATAE